MPHRVPWHVEVTDHAGSTLEEIEAEPDWGTGHEHRVGFINKTDRRAGFTHQGDEKEETEVQAIHDYKKLLHSAKDGTLLNFRDFLKGEKDFRLVDYSPRSSGWRYVLNTTEDWVKNTENWPANIEKRKKQEERKNEAARKNSRSGEEERKANGENDEKDNSSEEHDWKRSQGESSKHHEAYASNDQESDGNQAKESHERKTEYERLRERYTPQEIALLRMLQHEKDYVSRLQQNDGKRTSPMKGHKSSTMTIDEADQFSPDNWIPRSGDLTRLTGKHPLNAEAPLTSLFDAGLITPNELHYVRNHGAVPRLLWEMHTLDIEHGKLMLSMDELMTRFASINIPVALACDGNRRKELNLIKRSKGFNWGPGAVSCAYWRGPLLRDILEAAGVSEKIENGLLHEGKRYWVNFQGADDPSEGKYETCIPLSYAMDPTNDIILALEMNNTPLPPDHGYPVRLIIPGYVGGRCVKWLQKVWISDTENESYYHIYDNRVLPSFVTEKDGDFAETLFRHPDTACNEQNLNSVITKPTQGESIPLNQARKGKTYRIEGYAYDGGGHEVQRVEVSLDDGKTWLYCLRVFPDAPIRHGNKYWTWLHWHVDVEITHLLQAKTIAVRCFNVFKNTQPEHAIWNTMGMMNNCWYKVRPEISIDDNSGDARVLFRHPVEPGTGDGGWQQASVENRIEQVKQNAGTPQKNFTREEIEKHNSEQDCWLVVDGKVYDCTSVLAWHPGGKAAILGHAGKVHKATSDEFASIHDGFAYQKLKECILGVVTEKAANYIEKQSEAEAKDAAASKSASSDIILQKHRWVPVKLKARRDVSKDTRVYTFSMPNSKTRLGLGTCQHVQIGFHFKDKMVIRSYTPSRPLLPARTSDKQLRDQGECDSDRNDDPTDSEAQRDGDGTFDLTVKTYFPSGVQPGGAMSNILDCISIGEEVELRGPTGDIVYNGNGAFNIEGKKLQFTRINLILGGSGITPGYALIARILWEQHDRTEICVVDANKTENDILLHDALDEFVRKSNGQLRITHVLSHPSEDWIGEKGHINEDIMKKSLFGATEKTCCFLCGPPAMIQKAALPVLRNWGFEEEKNCFGF